MELNFAGNNFLVIMRSVIQFFYHSPSYAETNDPLVH